MKFKRRYLEKLPLLNKKRYKRKTPILFPSPPCCCAPMFVCKCYLHPFSVTAQTWGPSPHSDKKRKEPGSWGYSCSPDFHPSSDLTWGNKCLYWLNPFQLVLGRKHSSATTDVPFVWGKPLTFPIHSPHHQEKRTILISRVILERKKAGTTSPFFTLGSRHFRRDPELCNGRDQVWPGWPGVS